jgi:hypothetical protein
MSDLEAGAGAHLELGPVSLGAILNLQAGIESIAKTFSDWKQQEADYEIGATDQSVAQNGIVNAAGFLVVDLGGPNQEFYWEVRQLVVSNIVPTTSVTGTAYAYTTPVQPAAAAPLAPGITDIFASVPLAHFYGARQFVLHAPEHLFVVFAGAANGATLGAFATVTQTRDRRRVSIVTDI